MSNPHRPLDTSFSLYLDATRFSAAALVVLAHYLQYGVVQGAAGRFLPQMGREAVVIFFVLSGFVIASSTESKQLSARAYIVARCARIYSVVLPILLLAFAFAGIGAWLFHVPVPNLYQVARAYVYLPFHLLFAGEMWTLSIEPPLLAPYWSLGYEVWYYVLFGVMFYLRGTRRWLVAALVLAVVGYNLWLLLPVWLGGVWLYHWQKRHQLRPALARIGWVASLALLAAYKLAGTDALLRQFVDEHWQLPALPLGGTDQFLGDYVVGAIVLANFACARWARFDAIAHVARPVRALSSHTFTLYLLHGLILAAWRSLGRIDGSLATLAAVTASIVVATWLLGLVTERRKDRVQALFEAIAARLARGDKPAPAPAAQDRARRPGQVLDSIAEKPSLPR
jgi:peptidoglycan/LPS O-acetylase OafA/YrhL